jgi:hypothetical protein
VSGLEGGYDAFARRLVAGGVVTDPWLDGTPRFATEPEVLPADEWRALARAAEQVAAVYDELGALVDDDPGLLETFFALTPYQRAMWQASSPLWHGIARADVFVTDEGPTITEINCDTPTGEAEATELGRLAHTTRPELTDPNVDLEARFVAMVTALVRHCVDGDAPRVAGIVYPTEFTEDLPLVRLYRAWLERAGWSVVLGSPYNLGRAGDGCATLFDTPLGLLVRHYKTDWWGERASAWLDERIPDAQPLAEPLAAALGSFVDRRTAVVNPFGAVLLQNKRAMAFMWEHVHRFSPAAQGVIQRLVPYTSRLETLHPAQLATQREQWVLKSDYGAEGDEVIIGRAATELEWTEALRLARPGRWIAQRYFHARERANGETMNYGVFLVAGEAAGLYLRAQAGATDDRARSVPALVAGE